MHPFYLFYFHLLELFLLEFEWTFLQDRVGFIVIFLNNFVLLIVLEVQCWINRLKIKFFTSSKWRNTLNIKIIYLVQFQVRNLIDNLLVQFDFKLIVGSTNIVKVPHDEKVIISKLFKREFVILSSQRVNLLDFNYERLPVMHYFAILYL